MPDTSEFATYKHLICIERLVESARGVRSPCLYTEMKYMACNRKTDWGAAVQGMPTDQVPDCLKWCEGFIADLMLLKQRAGEFETRMLKKHGIDLDSFLGSKLHEERKVVMLLTRGETYAAEQDLCEDVLLRAVRRMETLADWAYTACMRYHAELTEKQMQQYTGLEIPRMVVLERAKQKLQEAPASELIDKVQTGRRTWGEVLLGSPVKPALMP